MLWIGYLVFIAVSLTYDLMKGEFIANECTLMLCTVNPWKVLVNLYEIQQIFLWNHTYVFPCYISSAISNEKLSTTRQQRLGSICKFSTSIVPAWVATHITKCTYFNLAAASRWFCVGWPEIQQPDTCRFQCVGNHRPRWKRPGFYTEARVSRPSKLVP